MKAIIALVIGTLAVAAQGSYLPATTAVVSGATAWPYNAGWNSWNGWNNWDNHYNGHHGLAAYPYAQGWSPAYGLYGHKTSYPWGQPWGTYGAGYAGNYGWGKKYVY
ncbi:uncharacterized protein LOC110677061 isoform X2 [Aedes aegypti]|uniref:Uncharacterized protein n=1 Tax=Aedes aegypti TaxID=7159 RepID=A0A6I8TQ08_AEDAE|nr:uncharacterized protein LOC110677061 isoform X2 [Aedes aegypti]